MRLWWKLVLQAAGGAGLIFMLNGLVNYSLLFRLEGEAELIGQFRYRLDEAAFCLILALASVLFIGMFAVLPKEKGYLYLAVFSILASLQLFVEWDEKVLLFGRLPDIPTISLTVKCAMVFLVFSFISYLLGTGKRGINRVMIGASGLLFGLVLMGTILRLEEMVFVIPNWIFFGLVIGNMVLNTAQFIKLLREKTEHGELRFMAFGIILFMIVILPDVGKDLLENMWSRPIGYNKVYLQQCFEDTFAWGLLVLLAVFGVLFFRRFTYTLQENRRVTEELHANNRSLMQEAEIRERMDRSLSEMARVYRLPDLEQVLQREGEELFRPNRFRIIRAEGNGRGDIPSGTEANRHGLELGQGLPSQEEAAYPAGSCGDTNYYIAVTSESGLSLQLDERERFALRLLAKYTALFLDYFQMMEGQLSLVEQERGQNRPWVTKLFLQLGEKERKRLASDLHDEVLQEIMNIRRQLDTLGRGAAPGFGFGIDSGAGAGQVSGSGEEDRMEQLRLSLDNAEFMLRETCQELMPSFLAERGVMYAVAKLMEKTRLRADFQLVYKELPIEAILDDERALALYRTVQELIHNALKHSEARRVSLEAGQEGRELVVRYFDDGKGLDLQQRDLPDTAQLGLRGLAERIRMLGGTVRLTSEPGNGFKAECRIPL